MSKIKIMGLGGLSETGKNTYVVEVDNAIFILDCGLKFATENLYGIDYIIPDFEYLVKNKKKIKGLFLTHGHYENMGATNDLVRMIPDLKVYCTKFTKYILESDGLNPNNIIEIEPHKKINFRDVSIFPISVSHSTPDAVMYVINTRDGAICYTGDFIIDPLMRGAYDMDLGKIAYVGKKGVLALLQESSFSERSGHTSPNHRLVGVFREAISHTKNRLMFLVLPTHLYTIQEIFDAAKNTHRKMVVMGKQLQSLIDMAVKEKYLEIQEGLLGDLSNIDDKDSIILMADSKQNPYACISKVLSGYDKFIHLKETDTIVFAEPRYDENEKLLVKIENDLAMRGCEIVSIPKGKTILHHASKEDLMLMIKLLNPKYYMPVKGEYRYMVNNADLASSLGIPDGNILLKQNGDIIEIDNGVLQDNFKNIKINDVLIDGKSNDDVGDLVIKDRQMLSENGIVLVSATISKKTREILVGPEVTTRGFIYIKDSKDMINEIKNISLEVITRNITDKYVEYTKIKTEIREELGKYLYNETECKPMIIAVIQEV
ncbi:MAG: ribonuclease J [Bacilli bacterium]|nr:ribonuclease J [Bacilli bacterium]